MKKLRVGVVGVGYFGGLHAQKIAKMSDAILVGVCDRDTGRAAEVAALCSCQAFGSLQTLIEACEAVIIATPALCHYSQACMVMEAKRHVFIEKPLAQTLEEARHLEELACRSSRVCQVGHLLRFCTPYKIIRQKMTRPLYIETMRMALFGVRGTDVSVILDMMTHDLDLIMALVRSPIEHVEALGAPVNSHHEDIANARLNFENGCVANLMVSRISLRQERRIRLFSQEGYISADFKKRRMKWINKQQGWPLPTRQGFRVKNYKWKIGDPLQAELESFVQSCLYGRDVAVSIHDGARVMRTAQAILEAMEARKKKMILSQLIVSPTSPS